MAEATTLWKVDIQSQGLDVASRLADLIDERLKSALAGIERQAVRLHIRLYSEAGGCTGWIRFDLSAIGGFARGDSGAHAQSNRGAGLGANARGSSRADLEYVLDAPQRRCTKGARTPEADAIRTCTTV
jgi:hypothetical protein